MSITNFICHDNEIAVTVQDVYHWFLKFDSSFFKLITVLFKTTTFHQYLYLAFPFLQKLSFFSYVFI